MHNMTKRIGLAVAVLGLMAGAARRADAGLVINPTFDDASFTAAGFNVSDVHAAFNYAANEFQTLFTDPIHVNIIVKAGNTGLGASLTQLIGFLTYAQTRQALINDQILHPSADGATSIASLPTTDPTGGGSFVFSTAEAKSLGLIADNSSNDGTFTFSNSQAYRDFSTTTGNHPPENWGDVFMVSLQERPWAS